jgi:hypothetical protein
MLRRGRPYVPPAERGPRRARRRRRLAWAAGATVAAVGLAAFALVASDSLRFEGPAPVLARRATPDPVPATTGIACRTPLTPAAPLRLWIGGDSLAGSLGPSLGMMGGGTGVVAPVFDSRVSSGLADPGFFDWPQHAAEEMARLDPEVVVFIIGTNDWQVPQAQPTDASGQPAWRRQYALLVSQMLTVLGADHRYVYWVGGPTIQDPATNAGVQQINAVARSVVEQHHDATYVDAAQLFGDAQGHYSASLPIDGRQVLVRTDDGIHFTPAGGDLLARAIFTSLDTRCRLDPQAVPSSPQPVVETPGSTQLPNTFRPTSPTGGSRSTGGSSSTGPVTTQPRPAVTTPTAPPSTVPATQPPPTAPRPVITIP